MQPATAEKIVIEPQERFVPGPIGRRFVAVVLDQVITAVVTVPISFLIGVVAALAGSADNDALLNALGNLVSLGVVFNYYGYFYSTRGATPGKMLMNLRVIHSASGKNLNYAQAFWRETIGKLISTLPFFAGYIVAMFREDKKGFHDMIFNSQVLHQPKD